MNVNTQLYHLILLRTLFVWGQLISFSRTGSLGKKYIKPICNSLNCKPASILSDWNLINHWLYRELINCFVALYSYKSLIW